MGGKTCYYRELYVFVYDKRPEAETKQKEKAFSTVVRIGRDGDTHTRSLEH